MTTEHPATQSVALIVNDHRVARRPKSPRAVAAAIIATVFTHESERWDGVTAYYEESKLLGPDRHRQVMVFYGPWVDGKPPVEDTEAADTEGA